MAKVVLDSAVPHLDRGFDYLVPPSLDEAAVPGSRVTVRFGGRDLTGWLIERVEEPATGAQLMPLRTVVTKVPPLTPPVLALARAVAVRQAGVLSDVLRVAVPPRVAQVEKEFLAEPELDAPVATRAKGEADVEAADPAEAAGESGDAVHEETDAAEAGADVGTPVLSRLAGGHAFVSAVCAGDAPRAAAVLPSRVGDWDEAAVFADLAKTVAAAGRSVVLVVPDQRDLTRLCAALDATVGEHAYARLTAEDGNTPRYRAHLRLLTGRARIAVGTRSAIWAPVEDLGLIAVWDEGDDALAEPRAPYQHVREVALQRARQEGAGVLFAGLGRTAALQRLVDAGWVQHLAVDRAEQRRLAPRVLSTADSWESARDPFARRARLPQAAWRAAREALDGRTPGPVLVQVARAGFIPALVCQRCRTPARCRHCSGPLSFRDRAAAQTGELSCRWCGVRERGFRCPECGTQQVRAGSRGVDRTADELGRAFPQVPVLSSSSEHILTEVGDDPALVVATVGAEPVARGGYAAALLLDGDSQLAREGLDVPGRVLSRWLAAAALVRPAQDGGVAVVTADHPETVGALIRWDPDGFASHQLQERRELHLPPAGRLAEVTGEAAAVAEYLELVEEARREEQPTGAHAPEPLPWIGPVPEVADEARHRALLIFPWSAAEATVRVLRKAKSAASTRAEQKPIRLRLDPAGIL
ncbi:primosomal protein N' [Micrococcus sp. HMSC067E09]|uniref:primosomal protein N' family DNA-binding protein n=1 Tax=Micrococcus sp. HMSC067E09 TaxID=1739367 RepID=UPI00143B18DF|nr:primosomal protein N' [Micrococcus sp. HMSC067E09]